MRSHLLCPRVLWSASLAVLSACSGASGDAGVPPVGDLGLRRPVGPSEAGTRSNTPYLAAIGDSALLLSWTERAADSSVAIKVGTWSPNDRTRPRTVVTGRPFFVNWADIPSVARLDDGAIAAHWLEREGTGKYAYGIRIAVSTDSGETWSAPVTPHTDALEAEHGFVSLWAADSGGIGAVWLDGRKSAMPDSTKEMTLRTARIRRDGTLADEAVLDTRICDCCQTATARTRAGRVIVYRDRSPTEVRDIGIVRQVDGRWTAPALVHADGWTINGCPVNGPAVAARGDTVAVAWFTKARDTARVNVATSVDGGATFAPPVRVDEGNPLGRVGVVLDDDALPIVSWMESGTTGFAHWYVRRIARDGRRSATRDIAVETKERSSGFLKMARVRDSLVFFYTAQGGPYNAMTVHVKTTAFK
ncbi:MAG: glycoside hydrolase [Gemmatimonadaceae bacterium]|jgi:hypothetical protein|nr:glycoside hydrolase [Gemmatimonadaceae bacterium]